MNYIFLWKRTPAAGKRFDDIAKSNQDKPDTKMDEEAFLIGLVLMTGNKFAVTRIHIE